MPKKKAPEGSPIKYELPPMLTEEAVENLMIQKSMELVYQRLCDGTASAQETCHFLKLGSTKARLESQILEGQKDLISAKTSAIQSSEDYKSIAQEALNAMTDYRGRGDEDAE